MRRFKHKKYNLIIPSINPKDVLVYDENGDLNRLTDSDDWVEVVEKDFEVHIVNIPFTYSEETHTPYSVRCKSNNKVWTIGDKTQFGEIERFVERDGKMSAEFTFKIGMRGGLATSTTWHYISELTEPKEEPKVTVKYSFEPFLIDSQRYDKLKQENEQLKDEVKFYVKLTKEQTEIVGNLRQQYDRLWNQYKSLLGLTK